MRKFVCNDCGGVSYSSAALEDHRHPSAAPECIHCGQLTCKEVPMTTEDLNGGSCPECGHDPAFTIPGAVSFREVFDDVQQ